MAKNINTNIWTVDASGYTQTVADLFTGETPVYTHAEPIDNSFNFCVNGVAEQKNRACFHLTNRSTNVYTTDSVANTLIPDYIYDNRGSYTNAIGNVLFNATGGVSNFMIAASSSSQPNANFKIRTNFTYLTSYWIPRIGIATINSSTGVIGATTYYNLNQMDALSTAEDAQEDETWWAYYTRKDSEYLIGLDFYTGGVQGTYTSVGAFYQTSILEGQTRAGFPLYARIRYLNAPHTTSGYNLRTDGCYTYYTNGQNIYDDFTFDIMFSYPLEYMEKKAEWDDTAYTKPQHNIIYGMRINKDVVMRIICSYGMPFIFVNTGTHPYGDDDYALPVIKNNTTTGAYLRGADAVTGDTENNRWANTKDIDNKSPGGGGGGGGGYDDDPWNGVSFSGVSVGGAGAFAKCYYMTSTELANLRTWMSGTGVPEGFDPMAQIIGLSQVPVALSGDSPNETVKFINSSAVYDPGVTSRVVDSGVTTEQAMGTPIKYSLGSVNISRRMQERGEPYLDYDCQVELYLPLIGVFSLDTQAVMGRTIEAEAILDPVSGTLAAYAWVSKDGQKLPIAYGSTTISVDLPITAQQYSVAKAALKQANAQLGTALLSSALTMIASASASGKASQNGGRTGVSAPSGIQQASNNSFSQAAGIAASQTMVSQTGNVFGSFMDWGRTIRQLSYGNNTAISGSFGGSSAQWSYPFQAYVKIIRPRFEKPDNYAHTQGIPCVQAKKIKNCTGFIQCIGVDVINIAGATDLERQAIQAALSNGIFAGGGQ